MVPTCFILNLVQILAALLEKEILKVFLPYMGMVAILNNEFA